MHRINFLFLVTSVVIYLDGFTSDVNTKFIILNGLLLIYTFYYIAKTFRQKKNFLDPLILSLIINQLVFFGGLTSFFLIDDWRFIPGHSASLVSWHPTYLVKYILLLNIGTIFMIYGYHSKLGIKASRANYARIINSQITKINPSKLTLIAIAVVGVITKLYLMELGLFGRLLSEDHTVFGETQSFLASQLAPLNHISMIAFVFVCYRYFNKVKGYSLLFYLLIGSEIFFAFIDGSRKPILELYILLFLIFYFVKKKVNFNILALGLITIYLAFTIVLEFKFYVLNNKISKIEPITLITNFIKYRAVYEDLIQEKIYEKVESNISYRINFVTQATSALVHADHDGIGANDPDFLLGVLLVPFDVVVPKSIQGTAAVNWGDWFRFSVLHRGHDYTTYSIPFTPLGYLYFLGGSFAVFFGFFIYGILLRSIILLPQAGFIGFLFFLLLLTCVGMFETAIPQSLIRYLRYLFILPFVFKFGRQFFIKSN
ncbi:MAG: hypothetical protein ACJAUJ_000713 [Salibacteraceae bacterium]|jgi:hypothetical protein